MKIKVGLTIGDPAGVGPAIALKAWRMLKSGVELKIIGDGFVLEKAARLLKIRLPGSRIIDLGNVERGKFSFGSSCAANGRASLEYLDAALEMLKNGVIDCMVTCPVSKDAVSMSGKRFFGHTEYLAEKTGSPETVMMLLNDRLRFSLLSRHIPLRKVSASLTRAVIDKNVLITAKGLREFFRIKKPKLVFCGLNPHASDNGLIGGEEQEIFIPAIKAINRREGFPLVAGVLSADVAVFKAARGDFDCVVAPYHDQALIALKLTGPESGVNLTLGLPFIRTSPLHGTAFDIARRPALADPSSLADAIKLAVKCALNRKKV
ncbi:MAG: 4-hydroxythreonine-4-phosphate dehydrogenase PdxA [Candidatus Omnitrophota bacterium]